MPLTLGQKKNADEMNRQLNGMRISVNKMTEQVHNNQTIKTYDKDAEMIKLKYESTKLVEGVLCFTGAIKQDWIDTQKKELERIKHQHQKALKNCGGDVRGVGNDIDKIEKKLDTIQNKSNVKKQEVDMIANAKKKCKELWDEILAEEIEYWREGWLNTQRNKLNDIQKYWSEIQVKIVLPNQKEIVNEKINDIDIKLKQLEKQQNEDLKICQDIEQKCKEIEEKSKQFGEVLEKSKKEFEIMQQNEKKDRQDLLKKNQQEKKETIRRFGAIK